MAQLFVDHLHGSEQKGGLIKKIRDLIKQNEQ